MNYLLLTLIFISTNCFAQVFSRSDNKIIVEAKSCKEIESEISDLARWTKNTNTKCDLSKVTYAPNSLTKEFCKADITSCVPRHVKNYLGKNPKIAGPNCWNLAMVMKGILPSLRYSKPEEMAFFMDAPLCKPISQSEKRKPGDIGAIRGGSDGKDMHGFIHVSENIVYSKNGFIKENPYTLETYSSMLDNLFLDGADILKDELKTKCRGRDLEKNIDCTGRVEYFRCISMDEYLRENEVSSEIKELYDDLNKVECRVSSIILESQKNDESMILAYKVYDVLYFYFKNKLQSLDKMSEKDKFVLGSLKIRLESLKLNIDQERTYNSLSESKAYEKLRYLRLMVNDSIKVLQEKLK